MNYSGYEKEDNMKKILNNVSLEKEITRSGLPVIYTDSSAYITKEGHSLVIGSAGSGKTQAIILPLVKLAMLSGESLLINDPQGEIYQKTANEFKNRNYKTILLDFNESIYGNYWNPLKLAYDLYQSGNTDKAVDLIENIGISLFSNDAKNIDPFWANSASSLFTGIALYLCQKANAEVMTINEINNYATKLMKKEESQKLIEEIGTDNSIYHYLSGILLAPTDTKGSIYSVFSQNIKSFTSRKNLSSTLSKSDFEIKNISKEKTVIYITSGLNNYSEKLIPIFVSQVIECLNIYGNKKNFNVVLDEFDSLNPMYKFAELLNYSRGLNISFTVVISSYINLINKYGKETTEIIKYCFSNLVYLYTNDIYTIEEISNCGGKILKDNQLLPLLPVQELQTFQKFEALYLITRMLPFKTTLIPDYQINWGFNQEEANFIKRD